MASSRQATKLQAAADHQELDPKYEWLENATSFVLRLHLAGFRKEDFRVQVDGAGRLTVRGRRADGGKQIRFHKVFQLPATSNLDDISGRFDAGVLTLTVPKRPAAPPATIEEMKKQPKQVVDEAKPPTKVMAEQAKPKLKEETKPKPQEETKKRPPQPEEEGRPKDDEAKKPKEHVKEEVDAKRSRPAEQLQKTAALAVRKEEDKPKAEPTAAAAPTEKRQADGERAADRESLAERVRRRHVEEETAKAAAEAEHERMAARCGWKERVAEELEGLAGSEWAEGLVETVKKNKEVIAAAVAAFSIGLLASRLFSRN
uniref:SHSP domain-containing protein n=1 Tax=Arundo donax TaxID=35708 RepID=A0A0A9GEM2_ARUDO